MKKAIWILAFIAILFVGDRLLGWIFQQQITQSQFRYSRMYRGEGQADILIVGNSRGLNFYQPSVEKATGLTTFSLCYYSMPCEIATVLTEDYLDRYPNVKTVLVETTIVEMSDDKLLPGFTTYMPYSKRIDSVLKNKNKETWNYAQFSHIYRFNNEVFQRAMYYRNKLDNDWYFDHTITQDLIDQAPHRSVEFKTPDAHVQDLKALADYCRARNINVKFVIAPIFPTYTVKGLDVFKQKLEAATGYPVHDYSNTIKDNSSFTDYLHANLKGGAEIVDIMVKDGVLPKAPQAAAIIK
jgi:hypothetical protein